jgi:hypothetical protein
LWHLLHSPSVIELQSTFNGPFTALIIAGERCAKGPRIIVTVFVPSATKLKSVVWPYARFAQAMLVGGCTKSDLTTASSSINTRFCVFGGVNTNSGIALSAEAAFTDNVVEITAEEVSEVV